MTDLRAITRDGLVERGGTGEARGTAANRTNRLAYLPGHLGLILGAAALVYAVSSAPQTRQPVYGGAFNPSPDAAEQARDAARVPVLPPGFVGVRVTASRNQVSTEQGLVFDTARWDSGGWWDPAQPTRVTFPQDGICEVRAQITTLGTRYGGAPNDDVNLLVKRDGDPTAFVAFARVTGTNAEAAGGINASTTDWFEAGEYLEVFVTPGLTVEANWPGRANVSPVLTVVC